MTALGPRTLKAIAEGMPFHSAGIGTPIPMESMQDFARRVALIAAQEERERCAKLAESPRHFSCCHDGCRLAAAIREGR